MRCDRLFPDYFIICFHPKFPRKLWHTDKAPPLTWHHLTQTGNRVCFWFVSNKGDTEKLRNMIAWICITEGREVRRRNTGILLSLQRAADWEKKTVKVTEGSRYSREKHSFFTSWFGILHVAVSFLTQRENGLLFRGGSVLSHLPRHL